MISKEQLQRNVDATKENTKEALSIVYESLNQGQQKKLLKNEKVKALLVLYGVIEEDE